MKFEIIIPIILMLCAIFSEQINKIYIKIFKRTRYNWDIENKKLEKVMNLIGRAIVFLGSLISLIYLLFFNK